jgi:hypothetical protein
VAAIALFDVLQDFGKRPQPASSAPWPEASPATAPQPDVAEIVRAEVERAEAALQNRMALAHETAIQAERRNHAAEIDAMLARFGENAGETIAARIGEMESRIGELAAAGAARILGSVLSDELQKRSMESLARSIRSAAVDQETVRITVRGPRSLFETLRAALGDRAGSLDYTEAPGFDLAVAIDGNLFETRLSEWSTALSEILS